MINTKFTLSMALVLCCLPLFLGITSAQSAELELIPATEIEGGELNKILPIRTHVVKPILLSFFEGATPNQINGEVFFPQAASATHLELEAFDSGRARIYEQSFKIDLEKSRSQKFAFQVPTYGLPGGSYMEARLYNQEKQIGRDAKSLPQIEAATRYRLSNIKTDYTSDQVTVSVVFENGQLEDLAIRPQIKVSQQSVKPEKIIVREFFEESVVPAKSRGTLSYSFAAPTRPGLYRVEVAALDADKKILSGQLEDFFVVPGDFAAFDGAFVTIDEGEDPAITVKVVGGYEGDDLQLNLEMAVNLFDKRGRLIDRLVKASVTPVFAGSFSQQFVLEGETETLSQVGLEAVLKNSSGEVLAELQQVETLADEEAPVDPAVREGDDEPGFASWQWWHWLGLSLALALLVGLIWSLKRFYKRPKTFMFLLLAGMSFFGSAQAALEVFWHHPVQGWYYNPGATGDFEDFGVIKVQGNIFNTLTQKGFFYTVPDRIVVSFFKDLSYDEDGVRICTDCFYLEADMSAAAEDVTCVNEDNYVGPAAEICDNKTYRFELDLPSMLEEGEWGVQILFKLDGVWYGTNWADEGTGDWYRVYFDSTPPSLTGDLTYDGTPPPLNGDLVYERKQPLLTGPSGLVQLNQDLASDSINLEQAKANRDTLLAIANDKLKIRNHKITVDIFDREQAIANDDQNSAVLSNQINTIVDQINGLTKTAPFDPSNPGPPSNWPNLGINDIAAILGEFVPAHLAVNPAAVLDGNYGIEPLLIAPPTNSQATSPINTQISTTTSAVETKRTQIGLLQDQLRSVKQIHKRSSVDVGMLCDDPEVEPGVPGAACNEASLVAPVRGNFCEYPEVCAENSVNTYQVCDRVGNCASASGISARIDWYDPVAPVANDIDIIKFKDNIGGTETVITGDGLDNTFTAGDRVALEIDGTDPVADVNTHPALFDLDACGGVGSDFYRDLNDPDDGGLDDFCAQAELRCPLSSSKRGTLTRTSASTGTCTGDCPPGYALQGDLCVPFCDFRLFDGCFPFLLIGDECTVTTWLPEPATVAFGDSFVQVNNCGQSRAAVGTKSITGTLRHFLDGKEVFGAYLYDTTEDSLPINYVLQTNLDGGGNGGFSSYTSIQDFADFSIEEVNSPSAGNAFKTVTFDVAGPGRYASWRRPNINVSANTDYILSYWVKTDASVNKNEEGAWPMITGNGATTDIWQQYATTMEGVPGDLGWHKVIVPFTTPSGTTQIELDLRVEQQNGKTAYFDDPQIFQENWRFDDTRSWHGESLDDGDGSCDYISSSGGVAVDGPDDRCGKERFPEKAVLVYTTDGFYIFDAEKGTFWMKAVKDDNPSVFGRFVFNALMSGQTFGLNGRLYLAHRFNEPNSSYDDRNGAVEVMDLVNDEMYTHRMSGCFLLAGAKGVGSSRTSNWNCEDNGYYNWTGFVNDTIDDRNVTRNPWSNVMPAGQQLTTHQINHADARVIGGKTYVSVATDYGISVLNKTDNTVQNLEWDGYKGDDYTYDYLHPNGSTYHKSYIEPDGSLWYKWNYRRSSNDGSRIWKLNSVSGLLFNNGVQTGGSTYSSAIQPLGAATSYPTTSQDEDSTAFDVQGDIFLSGGVIGLEKFVGSMSAGSEHPNLAKTTINKNYATAPLYGDVIGHWVNSTSDTSDYDNDLSNQGGVSISAVASGADLTQFNFNGSSQYLSTGSSDFNITGPVTFGVWVKTTGTEDGGYIMSKGSSSVTDFALYRRADNTLRVIGTEVTDIPGYTLSGWDLVVVSFDGTSKKTYLNGQLISNVADTKISFDGSGNLPDSRYVRVEKTNSNSQRHLYLAEVQAFDIGNTNIAAGKNASAYSEYTPAGYAVDGNTDGIWYNGSVFRTNTNQRPRDLWWEVDLASEQALSEVTIWNRTDSRSDYLSGAIVKLLDASRAVVATSNPLSDDTMQSPVFAGGSTSSLFVGTAPTDPSNNLNLLNGAVALPFVAKGSYTNGQVQALHDTTVKWFNAGTLITLQGTSNNVTDVVFGDDDDYFVVTSYGITHFDVDGIVIRTLTTAANSNLNTQIISDAINDIDYKNRYLIIAYRDPDGGGGLQPRGLEIITIGTEPND